MDIPDVLGDFGPWQRKAFAVIIYYSIPLCVTLFSGIFLSQRGNVDFRIECPVKVINSSSDHVENHVLYGKTLAMEWEMQCSNVWVLSLIHILFVVGIIVAAIWGKKISKDLGRRPLSIIGATIMFIFTTMAGLSPSYAFLLVTRLFTGFAYGALTMSSFALVNEIAHPKVRQKIWICSEIVWHVTMIFLPLIFWILPHWRSAQILLSVSLGLILLVLTLWCFPESPVFLLSVCNYERSQRILREASEANKILIIDEESVLSSLKQNVLVKKAEKPIFSHLNCSVAMWKLSTPFKLEAGSVKEALIQFFDAFAHFGVIFFIEFLDWNLYYSFIILALIQMSAFISCLVMRRFISSKKMSLFGYGTACTCYFMISIYIKNEYSWFRIAIVMMGNFWHVFASAIHRYPLLSELNNFSANTYFIGGIKRGKFGVLAATLFFLMGNALSYHVPFVVFALSLFICVFLSYQV